MCNCTYVRTEWDPGKARLNARKHGISFAFVTRVFLDPDVVVLQTIRERDNEARSKAIGRIEGRLYTVVFILRDEACRIISARRSNPKEERSYADHPL